MLPPYTLPDTDADLWSSGVRLTGEDRPPLPPTLDELSDLVLVLLLAAGAEGIPTVWALARLANVSPGRIYNALRRNKIPRWHQPLLHPDLQREADAKRHAEVLEINRRLQAIADSPHETDHEKVEEWRKRRERIREHEALADAKRCPCGSGRWFHLCHGAAP